MSDILFGEYARDESRLTGACTGVILAKSEEDIAAAIAAGEPFTLQGAKTGIAGACVPRDSKALNLAGFAGICGLREEPDGFSIAVRPGTLFSDMRSALDKKAFDTEGWSESSLKALERFQSAPAMMFAPDPTEDTATIGGMFATNAGGPASLLYGHTGDNTVAIDIRLANGELWHIERGNFVFDENGCCPLPNGERLFVSFPDSAPLLRPLQPREGTDLVDLFAGSEGMLGVVEQLWLRLIPKPKVNWSVVFFLESVEDAAAFMDALLTAKDGWDCSLSALEYLDGRSLALFSAFRDKQTRLASIPDFPDRAACAVIAELCAQTPEDAEAALGEMLELFCEAGGNEDATWAADTADEIEKFRLLRHAVPEAVNSMIDIGRIHSPMLTKQAADVCQEEATLSELLPELTQKLETLGMEYALFGHGGGKHFHINLIPKNEDEYQKGAEFLFDLTAQTAQKGGLIVAENGVGKLKRDLVQRLLPKDQLELMRQIKRFFDPAGILNPHNML
jgi:D-lactate dehydrogenase (cytochrome)